MTKRFSGQTAIITGASSGVGAACARLFSEEGANVVLVARNAAKLKQVAESIASALVYPADVSKPAVFDKIFKAAEKKFGQVNILVNNAGMNRRGDVEKVSATDLAAVVDLNLKTPIMMSQLVLPYIRRAGSGAIVNVASLAGRVPLPHEATYSATKFGLRAFSKAMSQELQGTGIHVSVVSPGPIDTGFIQTDIDTVPPLVFSQPMSTSEQVARLVLECAFDGKPERVIPKSGGFLTTVGYLFPGLRTAIEPMLEKKGQKAKEKYIANLPAEAPQPAKPAKKAAPKKTGKSTAKKKTTKKKAKKPKVRRR